MLRDQFDISEFNTIHDEFIHKLHIQLPDNILIEHYINRRTLNNQF